MSRRERTLSRMHAQITKQTPDQNTRTRNVGVCLLLDAEVEDDLATIPNLVDTLRQPVLCPIFAFQSYIMNPFNLLSAFC